MNLLSLCIGGQEGNARVKRARRGMEKDWNLCNEPLRKLLKGFWRKNRKYRQELINKRNKYLE